MGSHFHNRTDYNGVRFLVVTTMGSHFHNRTDYNVVTFLVELLQWGRIFTTGFSIMGLDF